MTEEKLATTRRCPTEWKKIFTLDTSNKGLLNKVKRSQRPTTRKFY